MKGTSSTPRARALAASVREVRVARRVGLRELADALKLSPQMLSQWERCDRLPTVAQVALILGFLRVVGEERDHILELARTAREPNWVTQDSRELAPGLNGLLECERNAIRITSWALNVVPGLLQTPDYARTILSNSDLTIDQIDVRLVVRMRRQERLTRQDPVQFKSIIDKRALHDLVGDENIMSDQMDHLLEISQLPNVSLRVFDSSAAYHSGRLGSFMFFEYGTSDPIVLLEHHSASAFVSDGENVAAYRKLAKILDRNAMSEEASRALIAEAAR